VCEILGHQSNSEVPSDAESPCSPKYSPLEGLSSSSSDDTGLYDDSEVSIDSADVYIMANSKCL
jgi:hypothetical protein